MDPVAKKRKVLEELSLNESPFLRCDPPAETGGRGPGGRIPGRLHRRGQGRGAGGGQLLPFLPDPAGVRGPVVDPNAAILINFGSQSGAITYNRLTLDF